MSAPTIANDGPWTLGVKIGLPFVVLGLLVLLAVAVVFTVAAVKGRKTVKAYDVVSERTFRSIIAGVAALLSVSYAAGMLWAYYPYDAAYHQYREVHGKVHAISSRLLSAGDGGGTDQKFVVVFDGSQQQFAINDSRAALVHPGDVITIACIRTFQYGSTDGYDCNWGKP